MAASYLSLLVLVLFISYSLQAVSALGSMSSIAISYGENGPVFCGLKSDGSHLATCYGSNSAVIYGTPAHFPFTGLTAGDGFVCGLLMDSNQPYCWGASGYVQMGVPQPMIRGAEYVEISAGDYHLCGLRKPLTGRFRDKSIVDCWGYNMTKSHEFDGPVQSISAGSEFNCGLFALNRTVFCWGDETSSRVISLIPKEMRFREVSAGGYHVCGIVEGVDSTPFCWGKSLDLEGEMAMMAMGTREVESSSVSVDSAPSVPMVSVVGGKFHACGIKSYDRGVICWGFVVKRSTPPPSGIRVYQIAAGNYFTCGILAEKDLSPVCWGLGFPTSLPLAVSPGLCKTEPCASGTYELTPDDSSNSNGNVPCKALPSASHVCLPCTNGCPPEMYEKAQCSLKSDRECVYNCSACYSVECFSSCSSHHKEKKGGGGGGGRSWSMQLPVIVAEVSFAVFLAVILSASAVLYVRYRLRNCHCSSTTTASDPKKTQPGRGAAASSSSPPKGQTLNTKIRPEIRRAQTFTYDELNEATNGFTEESLVGKGSFSCVYKGVLRDGTVVAVKKAIVLSEQQKNSKEFHTELDLLSRLNHAHLLNLLGYCEEGGERLLVYEFMAHGSLHQHLHGKTKGVREQMDWVRRVTIAVQAARGIEYLHGYACPPVIHRDIKSSNILIDEEHNARVADFGLSLLGPADSGSPLAELPAGTLGYLDPEYYRLHYLTTKSDVYSFGVLLLEILSGRKAIDMQFEEGNIVEWAVPLIRSGETSSILDPVLKPPSDPEALKRIANVACKCVRMRGKERPSMDKVTTALERALAQLMGSPCSEQPILPTEVVLGSSRMHKKSSQRSSNRSISEAAASEMVAAAEGEDQRVEFRAPSWITFPSVTSSQRRKSSVSEADVVVDGKAWEARNVVGCGDGLRSLEEEIGPASPQENLYLQHNF